MDIVYPGILIADDYYRDFTDRNESVEFTVRNIIPIIFLYAFD